LISRKQLVQTLERIGLQFGEVLIEVHAIFFVLIPMRLSR